MENRKTKIISVVAVVALALTVITATYAYFQAQVGDPASADIKVTANTVDTFTFSNGSAISFSINQDNFASGKGNQTGSTYASATLTANNKTNTATEHYYLYLNIESNTFTYSINESTPEIIMTVTDSSDNEVTDISTLNHVIVTGANGDQVSGYDITNKNGLITLFNNREITTTSSKEERWNIKVTFVNYDKNQSANAGKSMSAKVMIQKEVIPFHQTCNDNTLACHTAKLYTGTQGQNGIYYHDASLANGAGDNSYRFAGASDQVNNYVCFGSNVTPCPTDNLYRIIGVFGDKVKLIKSTSVGDKGWNGTEDNTWSSSSLNTYLNDEFLNTFDETIKGKIDTTTWKVGGFSSSERPAKAVYLNEIKSSPSENKKIGLMYASDYGFAAAQSAWTTNLYDYEGEAIKSANWMYIGASEWTISRFTVNSIGAFEVGTSGYVAGLGSIVTDAHGVRPVFSLTSSVNYASGSGTTTDPIIIN
ncbi:hypothetical protein EGP99_02800 [bacterium]|nr:hypothetical protein [bacterium]